MKTMIKRVALWVGLLLCVFALWRAREVAGDAIGRINFPGWITIGFLLASAWLLAVLAWRRYLSAYTERDPGWRVAMRQLGLLLIGKYVPGGVFGFLARMYDDASASRDRLFWAGLSEQIVGVALSIAVGCILYLAAMRNDLVWLYLALPLPFICVIGMQVLHRSAVGLPLLRRYTNPSLPFPRRKLLVAAMVQVAQQLAWGILVAFLAYKLYHLDGFAALGVAGTFLLAVAAGMLAVFAPGGIGVREVVLVGLAAHWLKTEQAVFLTALLRILNSILDACAGGIAVLFANRVGIRGNQT